MEEHVDPVDLKKMEVAYNQQLKTGQDNVSSKATFDYAWCLVRSKSKADLQKGCDLLEELFKKTPDEHAKRDYLFYLSVGCARLKEYEKALRYVDGILKIQPGNSQAQSLRTWIEKKQKKDALIGMAAVGGAAAIGGAAVLGLGALIGMALSKMSRPLVQFVVLPALKN